MLEVSSVTGHAGDLTAIQATVSAEAGSVLEPAGAVELMLDDEVFAVASIGADEDDTAGDGTVSYAFDTEHLPAGSLELWARFVPGEGYAASESDRIDLDLENHESRITVSPRELAISEGDRAAITARVEVLGHGGGPLMRQASGAPDAEGIVVVHRGGEVIGSADVDPATGEAKLRIDDLPVGSRSLRIEFLPDAYGVAPAETAVAYTVAAAAVDPRPVDPGDDMLPATADETLPATGGDFAILPFTAAGALSLLLGCALIALNHLMARRRAPLS